jgi:hypothetical protein
MSELSTFLGLLKLSWSNYWANKKGTKKVPCNYL